VRSFGITLFFWPPSSSSSSSPDLWLVIHQKNSPRSCTQQKEACSGPENAGWPIRRTGEERGGRVWGTFGVLASDRPLVMSPHKNTVHRLHRSAMVALKLHLA